MIWGYEYPYFRKLPHVSTIFLKVDSVCSHPPLHRRPLGQHCSCTIQAVCQLTLRVPSHSLGLLTMTLITNITHDSTPFSRCHVHLEIIQNLSAEPYLEVKMSSCLSTFSMVDLGDSAGAFILSGAASLVAANSTPISSHSISEAKCCARKRNRRDSC